MNWGVLTLNQSNTAQTLTLPTKHAGTKYQVVTSLERNTAHTASGCSTCYAAPSSVSSIILAEDYTGNSATHTIMYLTAGP